jgi:hypothetical protein
MESVLVLSSQDGSGRVQLEGFGPTRNRKVEGSNPSSGSKTAGQRAFLALLTAQRQQPVIPLGGSTRRRRARPASLRRCGARLPLAGVRNHGRRNAVWSWVTPGPSGRRIVGGTIYAATPSFRIFSRGSLSLPAWDRASLQVVRGGAVLG